MPVYFLYVKILLEISNTTHVVCLQIVEMKDTINAVAERE